MEIYFVLSLIPLFVYLGFKLKKALHMLQQNFYNENNRYIKWIIKHLVEVFFPIDLYSVVPILVSLFVDPILAMGVLFGFYILATYLHIKSNKKEQVKKKLVVTARIKRLIGTLIIIYVLPIIMFVVNFNELDLTYFYAIICAMTYFSFFIVFLANIINKPIEKQVFYHYKRQAKRKLDNMPYMEIVGITGSYGKTSTKNIVNDILSIKYNSFPTPKNFNTLYGQINTINNYLDKFSDFYIAEMGAFHNGDIKSICKFLKPKYGILTTIGKAHLESFGSRENIQSAKFELIESLPSDGLGILNADDPWQRSYKLKNKVNIVWIGIDTDDADYIASNIKLTNNGTKFDVKLPDTKKKVTFEMKLLGKTNVYNVLGAIALGHKLGLTIEQLKLGVKKIQPIEHRLEIKDYGYPNVTFIDDAYNSNPVGSKMAIEVLGMMDGYKVVVTPGMIDLGKLEYDENHEFGKNIGEVADLVILVGQNQTKPIYDGLISNGYNKDKIKIINDVKEAFSIINNLNKKKTYVLLENDLPDMFNERV